MENPMVSIITVGMNHLVYIKELYKSIYSGEIKSKVFFENFRKYFFFYLRKLIFRKFSLNFVHD